jgi:hypothetical protein
MDNARTIAKWWKQDELSGANKSLTVGPERVAIVIRNGEYGEAQSETRVNTRSRLRRNSDEVEVLDADLAPFTVEYELDSISGAAATQHQGIPLITRDKKAVSGNVRVTLAVNPIRPDLLSQLRHNRASISNADVGRAIGDELLTQVIRSTVSEIESSELRGTSEQFTEFYQSARTQLESQLTNYGLTLRNFAISILPTDDAAAAERQQINRQSQLSDEEKPNSNKARSAKRKRATVVVENKKGEVLLVREKNTDRFSLPGGGMRRNERPSTAAKRHLRSETNLSAYKTERTGVHESSSNVHTVYKVKAHGTFKPNHKTIAEAIWWDRRRKIDTWPHVQHILGISVKKS